MSFFFPYYGSKYRLAKEYPAPLHKTIIEPFAGGAGYSARWCDRDVYLIDRDPLIIGLWQYLIKVSKQEILSLPLIGPTDSVDDFAICQEAKWLIGFWLARGRAQPCKKLSAWGIEFSTKNKNDARFWSQPVKEKIASRVEIIRHWQAAESSYLELPNLKATWYIDPPYQSKAGNVYRMRDINYTSLGAWSLDREGQVIVCEQLGAKWLPFWHLKNINGISRKQSTEVICTWNEGEV